MKPTGIERGIEREREEYYGPQMYYKGYRLSIVGGGGQEQEYSLPAVFCLVISYSSVLYEPVFKDKALAEMVLVLGLTQNSSSWAR